MKTISCVICLVIASLLLISHDTHAQTTKAIHTPALLYKIEGKGLKRPSYLFGTVHLICGKDLFNPEAMKSYLDQTGQLMLELNMDDPAVMKKVAEGSVIKDGKTVKDLWKPEEYAKLDEVYRSYLGISFDALASFKPLLASAALLMSPKVIGCRHPKRTIKYWHSRLMP